MKQFKRSITAALVLSVMAISAFAGSQAKVNKENQTANQKRMQIRYTVVSLNNLSMAIDFWHDAVLQNDKKDASARLNEIFRILEEDVRNTAQAVSYAKLEMSYSKENAGNKQTDKMSALEKKYALKDDRNDVQLENRFLKSKRLILQSIKRSESFAYRYRLLADYQQLLRNEMELDKVEVAENTTQSKQDSGK